MGLYNHVNGKILKAGTKLNIHALKVLQNYVDLELTLVLKVEIENIYQNSFVNLLSFTVFKN